VAQVGAVGRAERARSRHIRTGSAHRPVIIPHSADPRRRARGPGRRAGGRAGPVEIPRSTTFDGKHIRLKVSLMAHRLRMAPI